MIKILFFILTTIYTYATFSGHVVDINSGKAIKGAMVSDAKHMVKTDENGTFHIDTKAEHLQIKAYGYLPIRVSNFEQFSGTSYKLKPFKLKAFYVNFYAANAKSKSFKNILKKIKSTQMNAVIIDIKDVKGNISYDTKLSEPKKIGATKITTISNLPKFIKDLKEMGIYTIARIAVFKDTRQAKKFPSRAVKDANGRVWIDTHDTAWVDPHSNRAQNYTLNIAVEVAKAGFDEVNFDYIRFPAKEGLRFAKADTQANRISAIENFLYRAKKRLMAYPLFISVDIFGYVAWNKTDTHIGQTVASLAKHTDYISPMLYPSGFHKWTLGYSDPTAYPYQIVKASILKAHSDIEPNRIRPWLQSFRDYAFSRKDYKEYEIAQQIKASDDCNTTGWLLWNPSSRYPYVNKHMFDLVKHSAIKRVKTSDQRGRISKKKSSKKTKSKKLSKKSIEKSSSKKVPKRAIDKKESRHKKESKESVNKSIEIIKPKPKLFNLDRLLESDGSDY
ncbi:COG1306 predicted glycoside hydrolase [hydrothermal vent metagenome]|uniref:COG1306 predicted glycoside hydrolase n=1 Tax=hydrothermal vent metagenome TaxID=652676 RepID=A0A1W1C0B9_9ZZZZ